MNKNNSGKKIREKNNPVEHGYSEVKPLNFIQGQYLDAIKRSSIVFGIGSAGTGKTYIASNYAAGELYYKKINKIIITRPNVEVGRGLGFLPGELEEKFAPYLEPFNDCFTEFLGKGFYEYCIRSKIIEPKPLGFLRGKSFDNAIILADEMQNTTMAEMQMLLSRIGSNCKMIISGDPNQCDISNSGLLDATIRLDKIKDIETIKFMDEDIVRSKLCKQIIIAYRN